MRSSTRSLAVILAASLLVACSAGANTELAPPTLAVGAIPDQDPEKLQRLYGLLVDHLEDELGVPVEYVPVTDYAGSVRLFRAGDLDLVWFGGLTGVQARSQVAGALPIAQRDIDARFRSVFIANRMAGVAPVDDVAGLRALAGTRLTFGSESSTSGRLMPQYFLGRAGLEEEDVEGRFGFSGSHDATIELVESGTYEVGALNEQVWDARVAEGEVDIARVVEVFRTPTYHDYHWLLRPDVDERFGDGFADRVTQALVGMDPEDESTGRILDIFRAQAFVETDAENYAEIEQVGRQLGLLQAQP